MVECGQSRGRSYGPPGKAHRHSPRPDPEHLENWTEYHHRAEPPSSGGASRADLSGSKFPPGRAGGTADRGETRKPRIGRKGAAGARVAPDLDSVVLSQHLEKPIPPRARQRQRGRREKPRRNGNGAFPNQDRPRLKACPVCKVGEYGAGLSPVAALGGSAYGAGFDSLSLSRGIAGSGGTRFPPSFHAFGGFRRWYGKAKSLYLKGEYIK